MLGFDTKIAPSLKSNEYSTGSPQNQGHEYSTGNPQTKFMNK